MYLEEMDALAIAKLGGEVPTVAHLLRLSVDLAQEANRLPGLKGRERLDLVLGALRRILATPEIKSRVSEQAYAELEAAIETVIPATLTLVVEASRGGFALKKPSVGCAISVAALLCRAVAKAGAEPVAEEEKKEPTADAPTESRPTESAAPATAETEEPATAA